MEPLSKGCQTTNAFWPMLCFKCGCPTLCSVGWKMSLWIVSKEFYGCQWLLLFFTTRGIVRTTSVSASCNVAPFYASMKWTRDAPVCGTAIAKSERYSSSVVLSASVVGRREEASAAGWFTPALRTTSISNSDKCSCRLARWPVLSAKLRIFLSK